MEVDPQPPSADGKPTFPPPKPVDGGRVGGALTALAAVWFVSLLVVTWTGQALSAPFAVHAALVTLLPYVYAGFALLLFAAWSALPDRSLLPALLTATLVVAALRWGPAWPARPEVVDGTPLRVMSYNVRRLWGGPSDGGDPRTCVERAVTEVDPDVLTLLEVSADDVAALAPGLGLDCVQTDYQGTGSSSAGGLAVCVRGGRWHLQSGSPQRYVDHDDWRYVFTEVESEGHVVNVIAVHLLPFYPWRDKTLWGLGERGQEVVQAQSDESAALLERVGRFQDPTVVAGDFNSTRDAALHKELRAHLVDTWERGGSGFGGTVKLFGWLPLRIDFVYATEAFAVAGAERRDWGCSDHEPVIADLVLRDELP